MTSVSTTRNKHINRFFSFSLSSFVFFLQRKYQRMTYYNAVLVSIFLLLLLCSWYWNFSDFHLIIRISLLLFNYSEYWHSHTTEIYIKLPICVCVCVFTISFPFCSSSKIPIECLLDRREIMKPRSSDEYHSHWIVVHILYWLKTLHYISHLFQINKKREKRSDFRLLLLICLSHDRHVCSWALVKVDPK